MDPIYTAYQHQSATFQPEGLKNYRLRVQIQSGMLVYAVLDVSSKILAIKEYRSQEPLPFGEFLDKVVENDYFLKEDYASVEIVNGSLSFSLIPTQYFKPARVKAFAGALIKETFDTDHLAYHAMDQARATAIFSVPYFVKDRCDRLWEDPDYLPACLPLINQAHSLAGESPNLLSVHLFRNKFVVTGLGDGQLRLCNAYDYQAATDLVYFIQLVMDLTGLEPKQTEIRLTGNFDVDSKLYRELKQILPQIMMPVGTLSTRFATRSEKLPVAKYAYLSL